MAARAEAVVLAVAVEPKPKAIRAAERALALTVVPVSMEVIMAGVAAGGPVGQAAWVAARRTVVVRVAPEKPTASVERR